MAVTAAEIGGERAAIPAPEEIREAFPRRIDLDHMEFEAEGFGIGKKILEAGAVTPRHSTGGVREMIVCLEGSVTVSMQDAEAIVLATGEMAFIPPATAHEIRNDGDDEAGYLFIYAREIEKEEQEH